MSRAILSPLQTVKLDGVLVSTGVGSTVTSKLNGKPAQPLAVGVITYRTVPMALVVLLKISVIVPDPAAVKPVTVPAVTDAVQANVVPVTVEVGV